MISKLKMARIKKELTQIDLWMKCGVPQWRLSLIERGIAPTENEAINIAEALEIPCDKLFADIQLKKIASVKHMNTARSASYDTARANK